MFCKKCGSEIKSGMKFCMNCGESVENIVSTEEPVVESTAPEVPTTETPVVENSVPVAPVENSTSVQQPVQPQVMSPQPVQQPMQPQGNKKKDIIFFIVIGIIGVALISIPIILSFRDKGKDKPSTNSNSNSGYNTNSNTGYNSNNFDTNTNSHQQYNFTNSNSNSNSGYNTNTNTNTNSNSNNNTNTKEITLQGYTFKVPATAKVQVDVDEASITNLKSQDDMAFIGVMDGSYEQYKNNKELVKQQMATTGFTVGEVFISSYGGVELIVMPVSSEGQYVLYGIGKLSDTKIVMTMVANTKTYQLDYTLLEEMGKIISSARSANQL